MARRIFVGLPLSPDLVQAVAAFRSQHSDWAVRWVAPENLHVTLVPPWQEAEVAEVVELLGQVVAFSCVLGFQSLGLGPDPKRPRLVWALGPVPARLVALRQELFTKLNQASEPRPFRPHLTLARLAGPELSADFADALPQRVFWQMPADKFCLYESFLKPGGADYRVLAEYRLVN